MGDFTLGCLLGQYDKAQSFDVASIDNPISVNSWTIGVGSVSFLATATHSSKQMLRFLTGSREGISTALFYSYGRDNDIRERRFPDINTHDLKIDFWANVINNSASQSFLGVGSGEVITIEQSSNLFHHRQIAFVSLNVPAEPRIEFSCAGSADLRIDDVLFQTDFITLHPEYSFVEQSRTIQTQHRSIGGEYRVSVWDKYFAYSVPLRYLSTSHAALINWWWENQFNLLFTLNTSDSESMYICKIANNKQPIGSRMTPYQDQWQGVVQLESIDRGSLVF